MASIIASMTSPNFTAEQKQVHVALSAFVSSMVHSTAIKNVVTNLPVVTPEEALNEPRKYRPGPDRAPIAPLDLSM